MGIRKYLGLVYRKAFRATRYVGNRRLPVCRNGKWTSVPIEMWNGLRLVYEPYMERALTQLLPPGSVFFDIGAHFGIWSSVAARLVGPTGTVVACEPSPAFQVLKANLGGRANVRLRNIALGSAAGSVSFHAQGKSASGSLNPDVTAINQLYSPNVPITAIDVAMKTVDQLASEENLRPTAVKIDVEGFELEVLRGARDLLQDGASLIIEIHPPQLKLCGGDEGQVLALLEESGYATQIIDRNRQSSLYTILSTKKR
jgi:FkbM family methyltransferase